MITCYLESPHVLQTELNFQETKMLSFTPGKARAESSDGMGLRSTSQLQLLSHKRILPPSHAYLQMQSSCGPSSPDVLVHSDLGMQRGKEAVGDAEVGCFLLARSSCGNETNERKNTCKRGTKSTEGYQNSRTEGHFSDYSRRREMEMILGKLPLKL